MNTITALKIYGFIITISFVIGWIYIFLLLTYSGLTSGVYGAIFLTNNYGEHYIELFLLITGFVCYVLTFNHDIKIKFRLRRKVV